MHTLRTGRFLAVVVALGALLAIPLVGHAQVYSYPTQGYSYGTPYTAGYQYPTYTSYPSTYPYDTTYGNYMYATPACSTISYNIRIGSRLTSDVIRIQDALRTQGYFNYASTGVFGQLTRHAVMQYQAARGLAATGIVDSTTWGYLQGSSCGSAYIAPTPTYPTYPPNYNYNYQYPYNYPSYYSTTPTISSVDGPTQVTIGQPYTWTVHASDSSYGNNYNYQYPYNNGYGYNWNSQGLTTTVTWGDEGYWGNATAYPQSQSIYTNSQTSFTHVYYQRGTYNATFKVTNQNGQVASYVTTVNVY